MHAAQQRQASQVANPAPRGWPSCLISTNAESAAFAWFKSSISSMSMYKVSVWQRPWNAILLVILTTGFFGCSSEPVQEDRYQVRGVFLGQRFEGVAMRVRHEAIPGFMGAMAMDFKLADPSELEKLSPGDKVAFVYVVTVDDSYAEGIEILPPETPLELEEG